MAEKKRKPELRFKVFTDDWERRKLGDLIIEYKETVESDCDLPVLTSSKTEGVILQEEHFGRKQQHDITGYNILPRGYCTYRNRSDGVDFTFNINKCCEKGIISKFYPVFYGNNNDIFFISLVLNHSDEVVHEIGYTCTGTGQKVLSFIDLQKMNITLPSYDEQKKIGNYFEQLDTLITLHQRKYEKLVNVKKSMLEKMFPQNGSAYPELRFDGFTDSWKYRVLGELFEEYSEKNHPELPALTIIQGGGTIRRDESDRFLQYDKASLSNYKMVNEGDFIVHLRSFEGGLEMATTRGVISPAYHTFHGENTDSMFYYSYFRSERFIYQDLKPHVYGIRDGRSIDIDGMKSIRIPWTSYEEQYKIGRYIKQIDTLITLHKDKLDKLKYLKQSMLQKMFV